MRGISRIGLVTCAVVAVFVPFASAQETWSDGDTATVEFQRETRVGSTLLKPGVYQLHHQVIDGHDYLAVQVTSRSFVPGHHYFGAVVDEIVRVPCRIIATRAAQSDTAVYTHNDAEGVPTVIRMVIRGEKAIHLVTSNSGHESREYSSTGVPNAAVRNSATQ